MQKRAAEEATARGKREAEARAVEDKTARLKAQRLEREATSSKATPSGEP